MTNLINKSDDTFRVLHTADWHLGKTLNDQSRDEETPAISQLVAQKLLTNVLSMCWSLQAMCSTRQILLNLHRLDITIFVSQLYKNTNSSLIVTAGNHDSPLQLEAPRQVLQALGAHVIGFLPEDPASRLIVLPSLENPRLVIAAIPFLRDRDLRRGYAGQDAKDIQQALIAGIKQRYVETAEVATTWSEKGVPILATGHLTVMGTSKSDSEREIHIGGPWCR